jgi:O-antigen ligase
MADLIFLTVSRASDRRGWPALLALLLLGAAALGSALVVQLAYRTSPVVPLAAAVALAFGALAFARPLTAVYASIMLIPLELVSVRLGDVRGLTPAEALWVLTAAGWTLGRIVNGQLPLTRSPLTKPFGLMVVAIVPGLAVAVENFFVVKTLLMWSAFFLISQLVIVDGRLSTVRRLLLALVAAGGVVGTIAVVNAGSHPQELLAQGALATNRSVGAFSHPNQLAGFAVMVFPAAVALAAHERPWVRAFASVAAVPILAGAVLSLSRGGLLALAGALIVMLGWRPFRRFAVVAAVVIAGLSLAGAGPLQPVPEAAVVVTRLSSVTYAAQGVDPRFVIWRKAPQIIKDHLPFGTGAGNFVYASTTYGVVIPGERVAFGHAHNILLTMAAELGVLGVVALAWITIALFRVLAVACRRSAARGLAFAVAAGLASVALQGQVDYLLASNFITATIALLGACAVVLSRAR